MGNVDKHLQIYFISWRENLSIFKIIYLTIKEHTTIFLCMCFYTRSNKTAKMPFKCASFGGGGGGWGGGGGVQEHVFFFFAF